MMKAKKTEPIYEQDDRYFFFMELNSDDSYSEVDVGGRMIIPDYEVIICFEYTWIPVGSVFKKFPDDGRELGGGKVRETQISQHEIDEELMAMVRRMPEERVIEFLEYQLKKYPDTLDRLHQLIDNFEFELDGTNPKNEFEKINFLKFRQCERWAIQKIKGLNKDSSGPDPVNSKKRKKKVTKHRKTLAFDKLFVNPESAEKVIEALQLNKVLDKAGKWEGRTANKNEVVGFILALEESPLLKKHKKIEIARTVCSKWNVELDPAKESDKRLLSTYPSCTAFFIDLLNEIK